MSSPKMSIFAPMIRLKNNTSETSKIGFLVKADPKDPNAFIYAGANETNVLGIVGESVPRHALCNIITSGNAYVYVAGGITQGSILRSRKGTDRITVGVALRALSADAPYYNVGTALETKTGSGLVKCDLNLYHTGGTATSGWVPYTGAVDDVDLGEHVIIASGSHVTGTDEYYYPDEIALSQWYMDGVGGFLATYDWHNTTYADTYFEGDNLFFGVYSNAISYFYGPLYARDTFRAGGASDYVQIDNNGNMSFVGDATVWDDIRIIPNVFDIPGGTDPDIISYQPGGSGTTFKVYGFAKGDEGFFTIQLPHSYKEGSTLKAHVHWTPGARGVAEDGHVVQWRLDYSFAPINGNFPTSQTISLADACDGVDHKHLMSPEVVISGVGLTISSQMWGRIYRWNDASDTWVGTLANLPIFIEFDLHVECDSCGSKTSTSK